MKSQFGTVLVHSLAFVIVAALAVASCSISGLTDAAACANERQFKCESPIISSKTEGGFKCGNNCRCLEHGGNVPSSIKAMYVCIDGNGQFRGLLEQFLEDVSAFESRNNITCVSKLRCTR